MRMPTTLVVIAAFVPAALSDVINVPADFASIDAAIDAASPGDEVVVAPGVYNEHYINFNGKAVTLRGTDPDDPAVVDATVIRGFLAGPVIRCVSGEGEGTSIAGLTIENGKATQVTDHRGGGLEAWGATIVVRNCVFRNNEARYGAGAYFVNGISTVTGCLFEGNVAMSNGGGMSLGNVFGMTISECRFIDNHADNGGGIASDSGAYTISDCEFVGNTAFGDAFQGNGGGLRSHQSNATLVGCLFEENAATRGGGVFARDTLVLTRCELRFNSAESKGGAILHQGGQGDGFIDHCLVVANESTGSGGGGGAIRAEGAQLTILSSAIVGNTAAGVGGGVSVTGVNLDVRNSILWDNEGAAATDMFHINPQSTVEARNTIGQSVLPGTGNLTADPMFVRDPDAGSMDAGDLRPTSFSPSIDAGANTDVALDAHDLDGDLDTNEPTPFDLDGFDRFVDDPSTPDTGSGGAPVVDIGPYEFQPVLEPCNSADLALPFGSLDFSDVIAFLVAYGANGAEADLAEPFGQWDFSDVVAFLGAFGAGCP